MSAKQKPVSGITLAEVARALGAKLHGSPKKRITGVSSLEEAGASELSFVASSKFLRALANSKAGAVLVSELPTPKGRRNYLVLPNPYLGFARALELFYTEEPEWTGTHPRAVVGKGCRIAKETCIHPGVILGKDCRIAKHVTLHSGVVLGDGVTVGAGSSLFYNVSVYAGSRIGKKVRIHAGSVIGSDGFGYAQDGRTHVKIPQIGIVRIEDDVEIGASVTIDRAALGETVIGKNTKIDNLCQIGHNCKLGKGCILVSQVGIAGSTTLGDYVMVGGQTGFSGHLKIGNNVQVGAKSAVFKDVPDGAFVTGIPAVNRKDWLKLHGALRRLPAALEKFRS